MDDADVLDADMIACKDGRDGGDPSGLVDDIAVQGKLLFDGSGGTVGHGVPVVSGVFK